jgi:hypothetical protein
MDADESYRRRRKMPTRMYLRIKFGSEKGYKSRRSKTICASASTAVADRVDDHCRALHRRTAERRNAGCLENRRLHLERDAPPQCVGGHHETGENTEIDTGGDVADSLRSTRRVTRTMRWKCSRKMAANSDSIQLPPHDCSLYSCITPAGYLL